MQEVSKAGAGFEGLVPRADRETLPANIPPEVWETMPEGAREAHRARLAEIHRRNATTEGKRYAWLLRLDMANQVVDEPMIWFPYFCDFRGRIYSAVTDLSPQGNDASKALLRFAHGKPLGKLGLHWLCVRAANCYAQDGLDKLDPYDRARWAEANMDRIHEAADNPIDGTRWWTEAEDPWSFLATCFEISAAMRSDDDFISHLPIPLDGSCNGLQHLAALGRDPVGAVATNVISERGARRDIYTEVARMVNRMVTEDAGKGNELAQQWLGKVNRKVVKRAVMTTPYGVTDRGIGRQLLEEGFTEGMGEESAAAANYLKDLIVKAIDETVISAKQIMAWLQAAAEALAKHDIPFSWKTPTGNTVEQAYWDLVEHRVESLVGQTTLYREASSSGLRRRKQCLSAAPNVVHSFDASHLCRVVNACTKVGLLDFAVVHDSFGVHAADTAQLGDMLRDEFAKMYETNWLQEIENYVREYAPQAQIPPWTEYVTLGDLQLFPAVMQSRYAFA